MRTIIYYFSATGNSLVVANHLAEELGDTAVLPLTKALGLPQNYSCERIGIVFPVYMFGLPLIVAEFLKSLKVKKDAYVFSVVTMGGFPGRALNLTKDILKKNGIELASGFCVRMPGNYTPLYEAINIEEQAKLFQKERLRIKEIASHINAQKYGLFNEGPFIINFLIYKLFYRIGLKRIPAADKKFWFTEACIKCGLCANVCPVSNIELSEGHPQWLHHCQHCMACLQWCPVQAIQYRRLTLGRRRYHHPDINAQQIASQR